MPQQSAAKLQDEFRGVLTQYGRFVQHAKYGEVWIPTVTPQGWHPYPPCNWVNTRKYGWYYDDKTPWGAIVHHYGRWVSDAQLGWIWTPGAEFSPGWVVWRTSPEWVGWAPMLPDQDVQTVSTADFNSAAYWIFVETQKFAQGCNGAAPPQQIPMLLTADDLRHRRQARRTESLSSCCRATWSARGSTSTSSSRRGRPGSWRRILIDWNFIWNNLAVMSAVAPDCPPVQSKAGRRIQSRCRSTTRCRRCRRVPIKPIDNGPPVVVVVPAGVPAPARCMDRWRLPVAGFLPPGNGAGGQSVRRSRRGPIRCRSRR